HRDRRPRGVPLRGVHRPAPEGEGRSAHGRRRPERALLRRRTRGAQPAADERRPSRRGPFQRLAGSTSNLNFAALGSWLPAASVAVTETACVPCPSVNAAGDAQGAACPASSLQRKVEPASEEANSKLASTVVCPLGNGNVAGGCSVIVVSGAPVSRVNLR